MLGLALQKTAGKIERREMMYRGQEYRRQDAKKVR